MSHIPWPPNSYNLNEVVKFPLEKCNVCGWWNHPPDARIIERVSETTFGGMEVDKTTTPWSPKRVGGCELCGANWEQAVTAHGPFWPVR